MGRLIAGVIALAIGVLGAMYWGQAQQANASQREPLVPSIGAPASLPDKAAADSVCPYVKEHCGDGEACADKQGPCHKSQGGCSESQGSCSRDAQAKEAQSTV
jgi:hypothetical protein